MDPKIKDIVELVSNFECPDQETIPKGSYGRLCAINEQHDIGTVDFTNVEGLPVVPMVLLKVKEQHPSNKQVVEEAPKEEATISPKGAIKYDKHKDMISLVPSEAIRGAAKALTYAYTQGKYDKFNYKEGIPHSQLIDAALRHFLDYIAGMDQDHDSPMLNLDQVIANLCMLKYNTIHHPDLDDRYKKNK